MNKIMGHLGDKFSIYLLVLILSSFMLYYSFSYIPHNQARLDNFGTRVLENKARAIIDKYKGYDNAVSSAPISYLSEWYFYLNPNNDTLYVRNHSQEFGSVYYSSSKSPFPEITITRDDFEKKARVDQNLMPSPHDPENNGEKIHDIK